MVFSGLPFLYLFLPLFLLLYFVSSKIKWRNMILLLFSLIFYTWGEPKLIFLILLCSFICYLSGIFMASARSKNAKRVYLTIGVSVTLGILAFFKYWGFIVSNINYLLKADFPIAAIALPLGISFYTFQALTYVIDVYREEVNVQRSFFKFLLYISMFPQLVAGPIVTYSHVADQIDNRVTTLDNFAKGTIRFITGLGKKVIIANSLGKLTSLLIEGDNLNKVSVIGAWVGIFSFALQIYYDFSAYSDMAIGLGHMLGFDYPENFNFPYISTSVTEFWRRWHMTLGSFFRNYVYIPLGGNRKRHFLNLFIVWFLTGLWHGASWNFILWGLYFFVFLLIEKKLLLTLFKKAKLLGWVFTSFVVLLGWVIFYYTDMASLTYMFRILLGFSDRPFNDLFVNLTINEYFFYLIIGIIGCIPISKGVKKVMNHMYNRNVVTRELSFIATCIFLIFVIFISSAMLVSSSYNPFLYFRF